jgi:2-haloacid dehalogenase
VARDPARVVAFDVVGTLFTLEAPRRVLVAAGAPAAALDLWFAQTLRDYFALSHSGGYAPLKEVLTATLPRTLAQMGVEPDAGGEAAVRAFGELDAAPGAEGACRTLDAAGFRIVALTNSSLDLTGGLLARAGLSAFFDELISCDSISVSKPHPRVYALLGTGPTDSAWMVAAHAWDLAGAVRAGLRTAWVAGHQRLWPAFYPSPEVEADDLLGAAEAIVARA